MTTQEIHEIASAEVPAAQWAIVDQQGHNRHVGIIDEHTYAGVQFIRVRTPGRSGGWVEQLIGPNSVYGMKKISEQTALNYLGIDPQPQPPLIDQREDFHLSPDDSDDDSDLCGDEETDFQ